jgi:hypothetical protein
MHIGRAVDWIGRMQRHSVICRRGVSRAAALTIAAVRLGVLDSAIARSGELPEVESAMSHAMPPELPIEGDLPSLACATAWLNSPRLTVGGLQGKVVPVDFWKYTCINWRRSLPHVRACPEKYRSAGLVVIGVHCPEFSVERNLENVR